MRIHHLALRTRDLARLEAFYAGVLGLAVTHRDGARAVWLAAGEAILMLERAEAGEPEIPPGSMDLVAFAISPEEHGLYATKLAGKIEAQTPFTLYTRDPDGRRVGVSHFPEPAR